jgi:hypothetical protein
VLTPSTTTTTTREEKTRESSHESALCSDWGNPRTSIFARPTLLDAGRKEIGEKKGGLLGC